MLSGNSSYGKDAGREEQARSMPLPRKE